MQRPRRIGVVGWFLRAFAAGFGAVFGIGAAVTVVGGCYLLLAFAGSAMLSGGLPMSIGYDSGNGAPSGSYYGANSATPVQPAQYQSDEATYSPPSPNFNVPSTSQGSYPTPAMPPTQQPPMAPAPLAPKGTPATPPIASNPGLPAALVKASDDLSAEESSSDSPAEEPVVPEPPPGY